jgi:hypothetical protein
MNMQLINTLSIVKLSKPLSNTDFLYTQKQMRIISFQEEKNSDYTESAAGHDPRTLQLSHPNIEVTSLLLATHRSCNLWK